MCLLCYISLPHGAMGWFAVYNCGMSCSYSTKMFDCLNSVKQNSHNMWVYNLSRLDSQLVFWKDHPIMREPLTDKC